MIFFQTHFLVTVLHPLRKYYNFKSIKHALLRFFFYIRLTEVSKKLLKTLSYIVRFLTEIHFFREVTFFFFRKSKIIAGVQFNMGIENLTDFVHVYGNMAANVYLNCVSVGKQILKFKINIDFILTRFAFIL